MDAHSSQIGVDANIALLVLKKTILKRVSFLFFGFFSRIGLKYLIKIIQIIIPNTLTLLVMTSSCFYLLCKEKSARKEGL